MELVLQVCLIWENLPEETIRKSTVDFWRRLNACVKADVGHLEHFGEVKTNISSVG